MVPPGLLSEKKVFLVLNMKELYLSEIHMMMIGLELFFHFK